MFSRQRPPTVISLNYDIIVDNALVGQTGCLPDYCCDITTERYKTQPHVGTLLKIHGSLNWSYCPGCDRLDLGVSESGKTYKMLDELYQVTPLEERIHATDFLVRNARPSSNPCSLRPHKSKTTETLT